MVRIDIDDRDACVTRAPQRLRRDRGGVEIAGSAVRAASQVPGPMSVIVS